MNFRWGPVAIVLVLLHTQATAATLYMYGGNSFTEIIDGTPDGTYDTSMHVTGSFVLTHPLAANAESTDVTANVLTFSFSDGRNVISSQSSIDFSRFQFSTNASGAIDTWDILLSPRSGLMCRSSKSLLSTFPQVISPASTSSSTAAVLSCAHK